MSSNLMGRLFFYVFCVVIAVMFILPTMGVYQKLPSFLRNALPGKAINLGLDLRGGMHLLLEVDAGKAIENHLAIQSRYFLDEAKRQKLAVETTRVDVANLELNIVLSDTAKLDEIKKLASRYLGYLVFKSNMTEGEKSVLVYSFRDGAISEIKDKTLNQSLDTIRNRVDAFGVAEPSIQRQGDTRIIVQLPGLKDPERAKNLIGKTAQLIFMMVNDTKGSAELTAMISDARKKLKLEKNNFSIDVVNLINKELKAKLPANTIIRYQKNIDELTNKVTSATPYLLNDRAYVTGDMIEDAYVSQQRENAFDQPRVILKLNNKGTKSFASVTQENVNKRLAIVLDNVVKSAPNIQEPITNGNASITMGSGSTAQILKDANDLSLVLKAGALPAPIRILEERTVGPLLGQDSINSGKRAVSWGLLLVVVFMFLIYRLQGAIATVAVGFNVLFILSILSSLQATLTLPGIAGIALTIGMAVDCNIIINERIKEELRLGKTLRAAIQSGFDNSYSAIFDANITTFFAGFILLQYGTGPIKGFAVTLLIGIVSTLFTSYFGTKIFTELLADKTKINFVHI